MEFAFLLARAFAKAITSRPSMAVAASTRRICAARSARLLLALALVYPPGLAVVLLRQVVHSQVLLEVVRLVEIHLLSSLEDAPQLH